MGSSWQDAVADRAAGYVSTATWQQLARRRGHRRRCRSLALTAQALLRDERHIHDVIGQLAGKTAGALGGSDVVRAFTAEVAAAVPLPWDAKATAVARGLQVTGILLCVAGSNDLTTCYCFADLALAQGKTMVKDLLVTAIDDWTALAT